MKQLAREEARYRDEAIRELAAEGPPAVAPLCRALQQKDPEFRNAAAAALAALGPEAVPALLTKYPGLNPTGKAAAVEALRRLGPAAHEPLLHALDLPEQHVAAQEVLEALDPLPLERLAEAFRDPSAGRHYRSAVAALLLRREPPAIAPLVEALELPRCRSVAIRALANAGAASAAPLCQALRNPEAPAWMRKFVVSRLKALGSRAAPLLVDELQHAETAEAVYREQLSRLLVEMGPAAIVALADRFQAVPTPNEFRRVLGSLLAQMGTPAVEALVPLLEAPTFDVAWEARTTLRRCGSPAVEPLCRVLKDPNAAPKTRGSAAELLGDLSPPSGETAATPVADLLLELLNDACPEVREGAAHAIGTLRDNRAVPVLLHLLKDAEWRVRWKAAVALGQIGDPQAVEALLPLLRDPDQYLRRRAAVALGEIGDPRALKELKACLPRFPRGGERDPDVIAALRASVLRIEAARENPDLPIPAGGPPARAADLPIAATSSANSAPSDLPRPAEGKHPDA